MQKKSSRNFILPLFITGVFACMLVFFFGMHPIVVLDSDDWIYISYSRPAVPSPTFWNPSKILPELLMPLCGTLGAALYHMTGYGYIESISLMFAIALSAFIAIYTSEFTRLIKIRYALSDGASVFFGAIFLALHFAVFAVSDSDNKYMFWSYDANCYFNYTIPALLNCSLVMYFMRTGLLTRFFTKENIISKGILAVIIYLAIFSNLFDSVILAVYVFMLCLHDLIGTVRAKESPASFIKRDLAGLLILVLWVIAALFDALGGRASASGGLSAETVGETLHQLGSVFSGISAIFIIVCVLFIAGAVICFFTSGRDAKLLLAWSVLDAVCAILIMVFLVLLCSMVGPAYIIRPQVLLAVFFPLMTIVISCGAYAVSRQPYVALVLPIILLLTLSLTNKQGVTFAESNTMNLPPQTCIDIDNDLINQAVEFDKGTGDELVLQVIDTGYDDNWPHTDFMAFGFKQSLVKHGLITRDFNITVHWSTEFNAAHGLNITYFSPDRY